MDRNGVKIKKEPLRGGIVFPLLAFVLLFVTLIGFFQSLSPKNSLSSAVENTREAIFGDEEVLSLVKDAFFSGSITLQGEDEKILHAGNLPEKASLSFEKGEKKTLFSVSGDALTMAYNGEKEGYTASRQNASALLPDSAFSDAKIREEYLLLLRTYFSLNEKGITSLPSLENVMEKAFAAASPTLTVKDTKEGKENIYQFSREGLGLFFSCISEEGKKDEVKEAVSSLLSLSSALCDGTPDPEKRQEALSFLTGKGEGFDSFCKKMNADDGAFALTILTEKGYVKKATFSMAGSDLSLNGEIRFGKDPEKDGKFSLSLSLKEGDEKRFSLTLSHEIREDSKTALIRSLQWSLSDPEGYVSGKSEDVNGEITFSWGKKKGDLGLRLLLGEQKINFRGTVGDYKKGKEITFTVKRIELDHKNVLHSPMTVTISEKGKVSTVKEGKKTLFPDGEDRAALCEILKGFPY